MRRLTVATVSVAASLALAACAERDTTSPRAIAPDQANAANVPAPPASTCDINATKAAARGYFTSSQDIAFGLIGDMSKALGNLDYTTANAKAWAILEDVAAERLTSAVTNGSFGSPFVIDVLRCVSDLASSAVPPAKITIDPNFIANAALVLNSGLFDVRGTGAASAAPAWGKVNDAGGSHPRTFGAPRWGVEAVDNTTWFGFQHLVYGYPTSVGTPVLGPTSINSNDVLGGGPYNAFEISTVPFESHHPGLRVGTCIKSNLATDGVVNHLVHNNNEILTNYAPSFGFCDPLAVALAPVPSTWYGSAVQRLASIFSVSNAFADDAFIGGLPDGWSPFGYGPVTAANTLLSSVAPLPAAVTTVTSPNVTNNSIIVLAAVSGVGVPGVTVTVSIAGNNGLPAGATFEDGGVTKTSTTLDGGIVTINYGFLKAGGYTVTVSGSLDGFPVGNTYSYFVNVKNQ